MQFIFNKRKKLAAEEEKKEAEAPKVTSAQLRVQKDLEDLIISNNVTISKPDPKNIMNLIVTICIDDSDSLWCGGTYDFSVEFGADYPIKPPLCKILTKIVHPNMEVISGNICLSIIKQNYTAALTLTEIIAGFQYLFFDPDPFDPLNHEASKIMRENKQEFIDLVHKTLKGGSFFGADFKKFI